MKKYRIRKLINGYKLGREFRNKTLVAIPKTNESVMVIFDDGVMYITNWNERLAERSFEDKFGRNKKYTLGYFEWKPTEQIPLI